MKIIDLLTTLRRLDVHLWIEGDRLRYRAPRGALTADLLRELHRHKFALKEFLLKAASCVRPREPCLAPTARDLEMPLSFAQQRLWFIDQLEGNQRVYQVAGALRIYGRLDVAALEQGINEIIRRHETLRTTFKTVDGQPVLDIAEQLRVTLPLQDLSTTIAAEREEKALHMAREVAQRPFDLSRGPLMRFSLLRLEPEEFILVMAMHHIITDGWSIGILIMEIAALYEAFSRGLPSPLPELPLQYVDFARWQRLWLSGPVLEDQLSYWRQRLLGLAPLLELPTDRPRPAVQSYAGTYQVFDLSPELTQRVKAFCLEAEVSPFIMLLSVFKLLLHRYTSRTDICVGTPIANRNRAEVEPLIGFFVNTLALRTDLSGETGFRELVGRVKETALEAYAHQDLPFEMVIDALQPERSLSHSPLFQTMFVLQNVPAQPLELPGLRLRATDVDTRTSLFDLTLVMSEADESLRGSIEYTTDLFDAATIDRMIVHYRSLLESALSGADLPITDLPLLSEAEKQLVVREWNDTEQNSFLRGQCLHELVEARAHRLPEAVAVARPLLGARPVAHLTYGELDHRANQVAHHLRRLGVGPETLVGLCMDRSIEMLIGLLGILKAGGAYVPLDPGYPPDRLAFMVRDSKLSAIVSRDSLAAQIPRDERLRIVRMDADRTLIEREPADRPESGVCDANPAYVIYTSGSTGTPKGVVVTHRSVVNHNLAVAELFRLTRDDRVLQFSTINFDASLEEIFPTWLRGGRLVLRPESVLPTGEDLLQLVEEEQLTVLDLPTAYWQELAQGIADRGLRLPECLRLVVVGGERCSAEALADWRRAAGDRVEWMNTYGPTEATIIASAFRAPTGEEWDPGRPIPIGRPLANVKLYLLDNHLQPVPVGVSGELFIGGAALARGYLNRPDLTAERFIPDPFSQVPGRTMYQTGDLARYRPDGIVEFLGRSDDQVKIRGFRVEPREIESALRKHPAVSEAVVTLKAQRLVGYVVSREPSLNTTGMRDFLKGVLPDYMLPTVFVPLEKLPLLPSGKVDRRALPAPEGVRPETGPGYVAAATEPERLLAEIWQRLLGLERVGVHDNFFELGGDSILSIQVVARARQAGLHFTARQLFESPTIAALAAVADAGRMSTAEQGEVTGPVPLTPIQRWFFEQELPEPQHWNQTLLLRAYTPLDEAVFAAALERILAHHDALRMRFKPSADGWQQLNAAPEAGIPFTRLDLSGLPPEAQAAGVTSACAELQSRLNLSEGPVLQAAYFHMGDSQPGRLLMAVHHLVIDGFSWGILLEDLHAAYLEISQGRPAGLPLKTTSFREWALWLADYAQSSEVSAQADYWVGVAQECPERLPVDLPDSDNTEASARSVTVALSAEETDRLLREAPPAYDTSVLNLLLAALGQALGSWTGHDSVLLDLEGHGRENLTEQIDVSRTVGWFTALFPFRLPAGGLETRARLELIKTGMAGIPDHGIGYGLLRYLGRDEDIRSRLQALPAPQVCFNYLGHYDQALEKSAAFDFAAEPRGADRSPRGRRAHLIDVNGGIFGGCLQMEWTYSSKVHRGSTIERVAGEFTEALRSILARVGTLPSQGYKEATAAEFGWSAQEMEDIASAIGETVSEGG